jgi:hypothetical protein
LGLHRYFTWRFVVSDVTHSIISVDFLVDCRNNRILDRVTSLSAQDSAANAQIPSVKTLSDSTPADSLVAEFPDLTRSAGVQREVRHTTVQATFDTHKCKRCRRDY